LTEFKEHMLRCF